MKLLAIDSAGDSSSIALIYEDEILFFSQSHQRKEKPNWNKLLSCVGINSKIKISEIDCFAFGRGPGSYTGIRSLASFMKGLSWSQKKPLIAISNLKSAALNAQLSLKEQAFKTINVALKSDLDEVYFSQYMLNDGHLDDEGDEKIMPYDSLAEPKLLSNPSAIYVGDGWDDERINISDNKSYFNIDSNANFIAQLAKLEFSSSKEFSPEDANPVYLKETNYKKIANE
ncbi:MAG: tRNA (adenosine(37)-N6)-threonylcarbamoyltransferase complex dimerization subunit type 1 TsaB [SAR86 cluster bacterium]|uniref:tRNA threonylcarbamoyladenosine biosynthesis protein TsaB n=1 Tax=SAR86 cluster bacterium TaxID=2030880 RepID=A0A520M447_9GAMM|nr:MAG: tRNA (adenosine(37)-N6)-threonylcarbamoyltransferase complex dimerization subunit type 1 TsaB [SAR86 cluster bacterium]|tara:strand:+ start:1337 stop:2020 length:684 start_codon:yes stop_codon:yes gene_type:complete